MEDEAVSADMRKMIFESYRDGFSMGELPSLDDYTEAVELLISALKERGWLIHPAPHKPNQTG